MPHLLVLPVVELPAEVAEIVSQIAALDGDLETLRSTHAAEKAAAAEKHAAEKAARAAEKAAAKAAAAQQASAPVATEQPQEAAPAEAPVMDAETEADEETVCADETDETEDVPTLNV